MSDDPGSSLGDAASMPPDVLVASVCAPAESEGPNGRCYVAITDRLAWEEARLSCAGRGDGWDLAEIDDEALSLFLAGLVTVESWIGASDAEDEDTWVWVNDGTAFWTGSGVTGVALNGAYENWFLDEPNGEEDSNCARLLPAASGVLPWGDLNCFELRGAVCEGPGR